MPASVWPIRYAWALSEKVVAMTTKPIASRPPCSCSHLDTPECCSACIGSALPAMKPATQAIPWSASTSRLRAQHVQHVPDAPDREGRLQVQVAGIAGVERGDQQDRRQQPGRRQRRAERPSARPRGRGCCCHSWSVSRVCRTPWAKA